MFSLNRTGLMLLFVAGLGLVFSTPAKAQQFVLKDPENRVVFQAHALKSAAGDDDLRKLLVQRFNESLAETTILYQEVLVGKTPLIVCHSAGYRFLNAGLDVFDAPVMKIAFLKELRDFAVRVEDMEISKKNAGADRPGSKELASVCR